MLSSFKRRPQQSPILFIDSSHQRVDDGDWIYLETDAGETLCLEVQRTDRDAPNERYEGQIISFESELASETQPLAHGGLELGQRVTFTEAQIFSCSRPGAHAPRQRMSRRAPSVPSGGLRL